MPDLFSNFLIHWEMGEREWADVMVKGTARKSPDEGRQLLVMLETEEVKMDDVTRAGLRRAGVIVVLVPASYREKDRSEVYKFLVNRHKEVREARPAVKPEVASHSTIDDYIPARSVTDQELDEIIQASNSADYSNTNGV